MTTLFCAVTAGANVPAEKALMNHALKSLDGKSVKLSAFEGEVIVVNFWASWCKPCRKELPVLNDWHRSWQGRGARVVAISIDTDVRKAKRFIEETGLSLTVLHDGPDGLAKKLDLPSLPCTYLLDRNGHVVKVVRTSSTKELKSLKDEVESILAKTRQPSIDRAQANMSANGEGP